MGEAFSITGNVEHVRLAIAVAAVLTALMAWYSFSRARLWPRVMLRAVAMPLVLAPFWLMLMATVPRDAGDVTRLDRNAIAREALQRSEERRRTAEELRRVDAEIAAARERLDAGDNRNAVTDRPDAEIEANGARTVDVSPTPSAPAAPAPIPAVKPAEVIAPAAAKEAEWDVMPVFFGTDRAARRDGGDQIAFGAERGQKLEAGIALVSIPRLHQVAELDRPWALHLPYLNAAVDKSVDARRQFTLQELRILPSDELALVTRERLGAAGRFKDHALVFVHGYNTSFDAAIYRAAQIAYDLKFDGATFAYAWPSGSKVASYTWDRESAAQTVPFLREFLELVVKQSGARRVSIIAHSMGAEPLLRVLKDVRRGAPSGVAIEQLILAAPDLDASHFASEAAALKGLVKGITVYAAANDRALLVSRRFHGGVPRVGDVTDAGPTTVVAGVDTIDVTAANLDSLALNHAGYAENNELILDIGRLLETGQRPDLRMPRIEKAKTTQGEYWRIRRVR